VPYPDARVDYRPASGELPPGLQLNNDGSFSGTARRAGRYVATLGACTPAYTSGMGVCALTQLTVTVLGNGQTLPRTGRAPGPLAALGLCLITVGIGLVRRSALRLGSRVG
jgi:hypothetical protein